MSHKISADIVLLMVNKHEQTQLTAVLEHHLNHRLEPIQGASNEVYLDAGEINGQRVMVAKSLIGSTGSGASFDTVTNILDDLSPQVIIAVGIAWGAKNADGQRIGDILLSTRLRDAQHHKVTTEAIIPRGTIEAPDGTLLKTFIHAADLVGKRIHEGLLISIETLFDDEQQRDKFIAADQSQVIGGEMEGGGLLMALRRMTSGRVNWLIVKAICDWGFKKNADPLKKEQDQVTAARIQIRSHKPCSPHLSLANQIRVERCPRPRMMCRNHVPPRTQGSTAEPSCSNGFLGILVQRDAYCSMECVAMASHLSSMR